jgi:CTP:molybdopterin cytidylyltransferase MocA
MSSPPRVNAVVLAGGGAGDALARDAGVASKSLVPLAGAPMGAYVASALRASGVVERIVYVGPADDRIAAMVDHVVPSGARMVDSLALGFGAAFAGASDAQRILLVTGDVPWWRAEACAPSSTTPRPPPSYTRSSAPRRRWRRSRTSAAPSCGCTTAASPAATPRC